MTQPEFKAFMDAEVAKWAKIIKANNIHLPELPDGDRYMYDPKTEQLMVESPAPE